MAQFRLGAHSLNIEAQRWGDQRMPRSMRICKCCNLGVREDELHFLYCPFYFDIRCDYNIHMPSNPVSDDSSMKHIMNNTPWGQIGILSYCLLWEEDKVLWQSRRKHKLICFMFCLVLAGLRARVPCVSLWRPMDCNKFTKMTFTSSIFLIILTAG